MHNRELCHEHGVETPESAAVRVNLFQHRGRNRLRKNWHASTPPHLYSEAIAQPAKYFFQLPMQLPTVTSGNAESCEMMQKNVLLNVRKLLYF